MSGYKNILWIEDGDTNNRRAARSLDYLDNPELDYSGTLVDDSGLISEYFGDQLASGVELIKKYRTALDKLKYNCYDYDLIVFDLDFGKDEGIQNGDSFKEILSILKKGHVEPQSENRNAENFKKVAGYYLYLYLVMKGFPTNRMVILTGNSKNYLNQADESADKKENRHPDIYLKYGRDIIEKEHNSNWVEVYYSKEHSHYYRIRRLVYQACKYWIEQLEESLQYAPKIPFNKLYYFNENNYKSKNAVTARSFIEMLEHIQMLFPVAMPYAPDRLYYKVMQTVAAFHEESAKIQAINDHRNLKRYHSCVRNFRNWSSHNLMETKLSAQQFALLFCITLRTYFSWNTDSDLNNALFDYEKIYGFNEIKNINDNIAKKLGDNLLEIWEKVHRKLKNKYFSDLEEAIRELGKTDDCGDMSDYLFIPI